MKRRPDRSGRPQGSNALLGCLNAEPLACFGLIDSHRSPRASRRAEGASVRPAEAILLRSMKPKRATLGSSPNTDNALRHR
jgi:hypothetical protein